MVSREEYREMIKIGRAHITSKKYKKALRIFEKAIKFDESLLDGWIWKGRTLSKMRQFDQALGSNDILLSKKPLSIVAWEERIDIFAEMYNHIEVISCCDKLLDIIQSKKNYSLLTGRHYKNMLIYKMSALSKLGNLDEAKILAKNAVKSFPTDNQILKNCAAIYESSQEFEMAIKLLDSAIENSNYSNWRYYYQKGMNLCYLQKYAEARKTFQHALDHMECIDEGERLWLMLGVTTMKTDHDLYSAIDCFEKALNLNPNYIRAYENKAHALETLGYFDEAKICYRLADEKSSRDLTFV
tara:strand:+ start:474 stop:1370 length:897 start_codon:yes stop_codon:yes gene_type:complete